MKRLLKTEKGMTLLEVLAVLLIMVLVFGLVNSILIHSINQQKKEMDDVAQLHDLTYILKVVTKDVRNSTKLEIANQSMNLKAGTVTISYEFKNNSILRNGQELASNITNFSLTNTGSGGVLIELETANQQEQTTIYFRKAE